MTISHPFFARKILSRFIAAIAAGGFIFALLGPLAMDSSAAAPGVQLNISLGGTGAPSEASTGIQLLLLFTVLSMAPSLIVMMTSFTRIVVTLSFLRSALSIQQPSSQIIISLSLFLTGFIMFPVFKQINQEALIPLRENKIELSVAMERAAQPLRQFMLKQTRQKDLELFLSLVPPEPASKSAAPAVKEIPMQVVIPSFMISELRTAFQMGFVIFLPFLLIDMIVSSILMAMGMMMLPPMMVTLPLKILVFILADGWTLLIRSLIMSFQ
jgi:flagellar biosynthetic protein FliP